MNTIEYVLGFYYDETFESVVLINKNRPSWQAGRINGIGGKVEPPEKPYDAMVREFEEETGVFVSTWRKFCTLTGIGFVIHCYSSNGNLKSIRTRTDEEVGIFAVKNIMSLPTIPNLRWLVPMGCDKDQVSGYIEDFTKTSNETKKR